MIRAFIGVGSNIDPEENVREGLRRLAQYTHLVSISTFYREPALGQLGEPDFYNGVVAIETDLPAGRESRDPAEDLQSGRNGDHDAGSRKETHAERG